jgi:CRP-like cAMP-binding protein
MSTVAKRLAAIDLFNGLDDAAIGRIANAGATITFRPGDAIVKQGDVDRNLYVLIEGDAVVEVHGQPLGTVDTGAHFGEMALIDPGPRSATIRAGDKGAKAFTVSALNFAPFLDDASIARSLLVSMARIIRTLDADAAR